MAGHKVLITTSGIGSRLGDLTTYTNKALIRLGDKPTLSHIIESYPRSTNFVITVGHFGAHVKNFTNLCYPERNFTFVPVDKFEGPGSSLGYSILQAKKYLQCPFIYHASDTIIKTADQIPELNRNWVSYAVKEESAPYATLRISEGFLRRILDKGEVNSHLCYIGRSGIHDYNLFWEKLENLIDPRREDLSDTHVINEMLKTSDFKAHEVTTWHDTGNVSELAKTKKALNCNIAVLDKKDESIYFFNNFVVKFFSNALIARNRTVRAAHLKGLVPPIMDSCDNFYKYKKVEGKLLSQSVNESKFLKLLEWARQYLWKPTKDPFIQKKCRDFYITKTKKRVEQYLQTKKEKKIINGIPVPPCVDLLAQIDNAWLCNGISSPFHGDFILDNIIETSDGFSLLDWRQDFGGDLEKGDLYYDLAKLNHNLTVNHDIVTKELYSADAANCYILTNTTLNECKKILHRFIIDEGYDLPKVELLTALIWINMSPLHQYPLDDFLFTFGKYHLYKNLLKIKHD